MIQRSIQASWQLRVFFTEDVFAPDNLTLRDTLADAAPRKALVVLKDSLAQALPQLEHQIEKYFPPHAGQIQLVHSRCLSPAANAPKIPPRLSANSTRKSTATTLTGIRISSRSVVAHCSMWFIRGTSACSMKNPPRGF